MPRSIPRVMRRGDVFYFRMAVPKRWVPTVGKQEIKLSLQTCDPIKSRLRGRSFSNAFDLLFEELSRMHPLSTETVNERGGPGCLNRFSASISGASAGVRLPCGLAAG